MSNAKVILAPMAGVTDYAFRRIAAEYGADVTVTEMVSSRAMCYHDKKTYSLLRKTDIGICGAQIFGNDPKFMAEAAYDAVKISGCDFIDINMGCPMPKVANTGDGSGLMRTPELAAEIVSAVKEAVQVPVTVKMRKGWDKSHVNCVELAELVEKAGADMIAVHGRTKNQLYSGRADWDAIRDVKSAVHVPVIINGDIDSPEAAIRALKYTDADHVMVGRAAFGDPFLLRQIHEALNNQPITPYPTIAERFAVGVRQIEIAAEDKGEHIACLEARKHLCWYLSGVRHASIYKQEISAINTMKDVYRAQRHVKDELKDEPERGVEDYEF